MNRRTGVLIVDDSAVMRSLLRTVISADSALEVVGTASDGDSALGLLASPSVHPGIVLLDVEMPGMDGLETLRAIRARSYRMPVIMVSAVTQRGARVTIEALAGGASDYVTKPASQSDRESALRTLALNLLPKIQALTRTAASPSRPDDPVAGVSRSTPRALIPPAVVAIGASTGGPAALDAILSGLPPGFPVPVLVVQHMPELFTGLLAERLGIHCPLRVREAAEGIPVLPGSVYVARGNWHMQVLAPVRPGSAPMLHLHQGPMENHCRPAVDVLFRSVAAVYGSAGLAVVLTGMGSDGLAGSHLIRSQGGTVLAQDQASSVIWGMPGAVVQAGIAHQVLPLTRFVPEILRLVSNQRLNPLAALKPAANL